MLAHFAVCAIRVASDRRRFGQTLTGIVGFLLAGCSLSSPDEATSAHDSTAQPTMERNARPASSDASQVSKPIGTETGNSLAYVMTPTSRRQQDRDDQAFDPRFDGWRTEAIAEQMQQRWQQVARQWVTSQSAIEDQEIPAWIATQFCSSRWIPEKATRTFRQGSVIGNRWQARANDDMPPTVQHRGTDGWRVACRELLEEFEHGRPLRAHFKTTDVNLNGNQATTRVQLELNGLTLEGRLQRKTTWRCQWTEMAHGAGILTDLQLIDWQEMRSVGSSQTWFADCTLAVIGDDPCFQHQLRFGLDHWLRQIERLHRIDVYTRHGLAVGDVNGDGLDDVYLCQPGGLPNRLLMQNTNGTATDEAHARGVDWLDRSTSALLIDLDNDDDVDLVVATAHSILFMQNDGQGGFRTCEEITLADHDPHSLSAADYDLDGDLDIYVCVEFAGRDNPNSRSLPAFVYHDANDGGRNVLLRNEISSSPTAEWSFTDVTRQTGLDVDNHRHSLAAAWEDIDNDGDQDLYVANDYGQNCLYENLGGRFRNVAAERQVIDHGSGMSVAWGDIDHNGWMDLYVGNMFSSAGNRVTAQPAFQVGANATTRQIYRRFAKGNSLFLNEGSVPFREVSSTADAQMARWAWASLMVDINNDSWEDLVVANGYITGQQTDDL